MCEESILIDKSLLSDYKMAEEGRRLWLEIKESIQMDVSCVLIIVSEKDDAFNNAVCRLIPAYMRRKNYHKTVILCKKDESSFDAAENSEDPDVIIRHYEDDEISALLKYYSLVQFFVNIVVISLEDPFGSRQLLDSGIVDMDDYIENTFLV